LTEDVAFGSRAEPAPRSELGPVARLRKRVVDRMIARRTRRAKATLRADAELWRLIEHAADGNEVTGASYSDYLTLYEAVRRLKPAEILECGTGISTVVLAQALRQNEREGGKRGRITSMEEELRWRDNADRRLPDELRPYIELVHSPKVDGYYQCFRGVQYESVPDRPYDFVFSDGPERHSLVNGDKLFNLDFIQIVRRSDRPVRAVVDNHYLTFYVLQKVFGTRLARFDVGRKLMFVGPVTKRDLRRLRKENFIADIRLFGRTRFRLRMSLPRDP
jgi:predicted O-methyltransferase YrrM